MLTMVDKAQRTIYIKWVRSDIGFDRSQSQVLRSLGLRRLNQIVERPDTAQVRGLVAKVPHLVEVVRRVTEPVWNSTPAYTIRTAPSELAPASEELEIVAGSPAEAVPTPSSEADTAPGERVSSSSSTRESTPSYEPVTASEGTVSPRSEKDGKV
jgi:large subunit ribosomal protein L30